MQKGASDAGPFCARSTWSVSVLAGLGAACGGGERDRILIAGQLVAAVGRQRIARILRGQADDLAILLGPQIGQLVAREDVDKGKAVVLAAKRDRPLHRRRQVRSDENKS